VQGAFCGACGERLLGEDELTLRAQLSQLFTGLFSVDGRVLRSLLALAARPGQLAVDYCRGARVRWLKPVQVFLLANVVYFLLQPYTGFNTFRSTLTLQIERQIYSESLAEIVRARLVASGESMLDFAARFDARADSYARSLLILLAPLLGACVWLLDRRARRRTFVEALVLSTHFVAFALVYIYVIVLGALQLAFALGLRANGESISGLVTLPLLALWWWLALRRFYALGSGQAVLRAAALTALLFPIVALYRFTLFWITYWSV
jgi:hypothetical protein